MSIAVAQAFRRDILQLIILPTEKCNFRCTYCYEDFEIGKMSRETVAALKNHIRVRIEKKGVEHLVLSWFGGEPLLACDVVEEISEFGLGFLRAGRLKTFRGDITTNAYLLTPDNLARMVELRQSDFQVSLDGLGEGHDRTRKYISGKGTFDVIWSNLLAAKRSTLEFKMTLRCHMTPDNADTMSELVGAICREFGDDSRFNVFFKTIENLGGPNANAIQKMDVAHAHLRVAALKARLTEAGLASSAVVEGPESNTGAGASIGAGVQLQETENRVSGASPQKYSYAGYICYAAKPNSLMIRADGRIGKCTVLMHDPRNAVGKLNSDGTVTLDAALINNVWMRGFVSMDATELGCPAIGMPKMMIETPVKLKDIIRSEAVPS